MDRRGFLRLLPFGPPALMEIAKGRSMISLNGLFVPQSTGVVPAYFEYRLRKGLYGDLFLYQFGEHAIANLGRQLAIKIDKDIHETIMRT